jgi:hypothetical protein
MWIIALALALVAGWLLARGLTGRWDGPGWISVLVQIALGGLLGPGLASVLYFFLSLAGLGTSRAGVLVMLVVLVAGGGWTAWPRNGVHTFDVRKASGWGWILLLAAVVGLGFFLADFSAASTGNPAGEWDAFSIWNVRAEFMAGGAWQRAASSELGGHMAGAAHPGYPLFLSGFVALQWVAGGNFGESVVPVAVSLVFPLATFILLGSSLASKRTLTLGALAWLLLVCSEVFASQAASQYSDLLEGLAFLAALVLLDRAAALEGSTRVIFAAGLAIGLSAWVKNEGLPFALAALAIAGWRFHGKAVWALVGALPGLLAVAVLKLVATGHEAVFPSTVGETVLKLLTPGRWWQALLGFGKAVVDAGDPWGHPVLLGLALVLMLRFMPASERKRARLLWVPVVVTALAEYGLYLVTTADLTWHIASSVERLLAQLWPPLIWLVLSSVYPPEHYFASGDEGELVGVRVPSRKGPGGLKARAGRTTG